MSLETAITVVWVVFWAYWLLASLTAKRGTRRPFGFAPRAGLVVLVLILFHGFRGANAAGHAEGLRVAGTAILLAGVALAVWARIYLGRNWGMPMTEKEEPELVTSGPYRYVRNPIYSGIVLAMIGTALALSYFWFIGALAAGGFFIYSATVEERNLTATFPQQYPPYRARTKMLIPFVL